MSQLVLFDIFAFRTRQSWCQNESRDNEQYYIRETLRKRNNFSIRINLVGMSEKHYHFTVSQTLTQVVSYTFYLFMFTVVVDFSSIMVQHQILVNEFNPGTSKLKFGVVNDRKEWLFYT